MKTVLGCLENLSNGRSGKAKPNWAQLKGSSCKNSGKATRAGGADWSALRPFRGAQREFGVHEGQGKAVLLHRPGRGHAARQTKWRWPQRGNT